MGVGDGLALGNADCDDVGPTEGVDDGVAGPVGVGTPLGAMLGSGVGIVPPLYKTKYAAAPARIWSEPVGTSGNVTLPLLAFCGPATVTHAPFWNWAI